MYVDAISLVRNYFLQYFTGQKLFISRLFQEHSENSWLTRFQRPLENIMAVILFIILVLNLNEYKLAQFV